MPTTQKPHCLWEDTGCWDIKNNSSTAKCITMHVGYACMLSHFSCPSLFNTLNCSPLGSSVHEIPQARVLEWIAMLSSRGSSQPRDLTQVSLIAGRFFTGWATWEALSILEVKWSKIHSVMSNYTVHGILQARILEWVAFPFSRGSFQPGIQPRSPALQADSLPAEPQRKPKWRLSRVDYKEMRGVLGLFKICKQW